ncbi:hypothetical protein D0463_00695 [Bacillus sp. V59.32b]|nr:hypothetical protein D0463_00695 [Bacillus sp. V59.32b]
MIASFGATKPYRAGLLVVELSPQRLHVKPSDRLHNRKKNKKEKVSKQENKRASVQNTGVDPEPARSLTNSP